MKLSARLTLASTLLGLIVVVATVILSWLASASEIREAVDESLEDSRELLLAFTQSEVGRQRLKNPESGSLLPRDLSRDFGGVPVLTDGTADPGAPFTVPSNRIDHLLDGQKSFETLTVESQTYRTLAVPIEPVPLEVRDGQLLAGVLLYQDVTAEEQAIADLALRLGVVGLVALTAVAAGSWFLGRRLARPLVDLTRGVEHLASDDARPQRIELDRSDEIGRLADQFNAMLAALEVGREQQQRLVTDASHELRTPLTALRLRIEYAASFDNLKPDQRSVVDGAVSDLEQLSALVADLVDLATHASPAEEAAEHYQLASIVEPIAERTAVATGREISVEADDSGAIVYPNMIRRAVQNLLDNAVKYSPTDEPVLVRVNGGTIEVRDRGPGIAPEDLAFVFDRFFRSPKARNRPGNGIGLAIVKNVAETHGGEPYATAGDVGACVGFSIPGVPVP